MCDVGETGCSSGRKMGGVRVAGVGIGGERCVMVEVEGCQE